MRKSEDPQAVYSRLAQRPALASGLETKADIEELRRRQQQGEEFDDRFSFGHYYEQPPRRRRRRRPRSAGKSP